uniref:FANCI_S1 domain-containing protein n=1 Tax=Glossina pallidipes TaxID=7398 RepID=A0A1A9ZXD4_GLOPL
MNLMTFQDNMIRKKKFFLLMLYNLQLQLIFLEPPQYQIKKLYFTNMRECGSALAFNRLNQLEICISSFSGFIIYKTKEEDLLPPVLHILTERRTLIVNDVTMGGLEYCDLSIKNLITMGWPSEVLTPLADGPDSTTFEGTLSAYSLYLSVVSGVAHQLVITAGMVSNAITAPVSARFIVQDNRFIDYTT